MQGMTFDGHVGSLGEIAQSSYVTYNAQIINRGNEADFLDNCHKQFADDEILSESVLRNRHGQLEFHARIRTSKGI